MSLLGQGLKTQEVGDKLGIGAVTVSAHKSRASVKLRIGDPRYRRMAFELAAGVYCGKK